MTDRPDGGPAPEAPTLDGGAAREALNITRARWAKSVEVAAAMNLLAPTGSA